MQLLALDVALLLPPDVRQRAIELSATLPDEADGLRLDDDHHPHVTLTQAFVRAEELDDALQRVDEVLIGRAPMPIRVTGIGRSGNTMWLAIERAPELVGLHENVMEALRGYERPGGTPAAFVDGHGRVADVVWVASYRLQSAFHAYEPHVTLGHGDHPPEVAPFTFVADTVAACQLGRFCACQRLLRVWTLTDSAGSERDSRRRSQSPS